MVYLFDALKQLLRAICDRLDHRMLLPRLQPLLELMESEEAAMVRYKQKTSLFAHEDVVLLPIANTTAELPAACVANRLVAATLASWQAIPDLDEVENARSFGLSVICRRTVTSR